MKTINKLPIIVIVLLMISAIGLNAQDTTKLKQQTKQQLHSQSFIDEDGDGYNDNAPDHDGDGIPNGLDPDWTKQKRKRASQAEFIDLDGDGINDNMNEVKEHAKFGKMEEINKGKGSPLDNKTEMGKGKGKGKNR